MGRAAADPAYDDMNLSDVDMIVAAGIAVDKLEDTADTPIVVVGVMVVLVVVLMAVVVDDRLVVVVVVVRVEEEEGEEEGVLVVIGWKGIDRLQLP